MNIRHVDVERWSIVSSRSFDLIVRELGAAIGHPDAHQLANAMRESPTYEEYGKRVESMAGPSGFLEMLRLDVGAVLRKANGATAPRSFRFIVGNPVIMEQMAARVPDAASYAPVTILVDERPDGVHLSYDRMVSFLRPYGNADALQRAAALDAKVEKLLSAVASND